MVLACLVGLFPTPAATPQPQLPSPPASVGTTSADPSPEPALRVGLATDLKAFDLACCEPRVQVAVGAERWALDAPIRVEPAAERVEHPIFRLQVAALKDEERAHGIATYLQQTTPQPADAVFDAGTDLYRVRWGNFPSRAAAESARGELESLGLTQGWVVSEGGNLQNPGLRVSQGKRSVLVPGRWLAVQAPAEVGIAWGAGRYRNLLLIFLNDRGWLNVINELSIEDYLRGVVPKEMGPELYDQLEAQKAQAVAARTFAWRHLGEFAAEGYDICSTPRCQVYSGMDVEHPRSDQAIRETRGQVVLFAGEPAETFYSATCGGHTENVEVVFPLKHGAYLQGEPCLEAGVTQLAGTLPESTPFPLGLMHQLLPSPAGPADKPHQLLGARLELLAFKAGLPLPQDRLAAVEQREVLRFIASVFDLALGQRLLLALREPEGLRAAFSDLPAADRDLAANLAASGLLAGPGTRRLVPAEIETLLFHLALRLGVLTRTAGYFLELERGELVIKAGMARSRFALPGDVMTFRRTSAGLAAALLQLMPGDRLELYRHKKQLLAVVQPDAVRPVSFERQAPRQRWTRFLTTAEARSAVQARYPGFPFQDFEIVDRGVSGRIGKLRLLGSDGRSLLIEGLAVRWTFDLPDTWFQVERQEQRQSAGWLFRGRGWGHGVGMCQTGAFGMALRGSTYRQILDHYYTGIELGQVTNLPARPNAALTQAPRGQTSSSGQMKDGQTGPSAE